MMMRTSSAEARLGDRRPVGGAGGSPADGLCGCHPARSDRRERRRGGWLSRFLGPPGPDPRRIAARSRFGRAVTRTGEEARPAPAVVSSYSVGVDRPDLGPFVEMSLAENPHIRDERAFNRLNGGVRPGPSPRATTTAFAVAGALVTLTVIVLPSVHFAYRSLSAHLVIETAAGVIALILAYLTAWRFRRRQRWDDLLLAIGLAVLALSSLALTLVPVLVEAGPARFPTWSSLLAGVIGSAIIAASAFAPGRPVRHAERHGLLVAGAAIAVVAVAAITAALLHSRLPAAIDPRLSPEGSARPRVVGPATVLTLQLGAAIALAAAAVGFTRRAAATDEPLVRWLGPAASLGAFARLNYFLFPSLYSEWLYTGDLLRLAFYAVLLGGGAAQIAADQRELARTAAREERRRVARDLHDGLSHELAFIATRSRNLAAASDDPLALQLARAAERALDESRDAIVALSSGADEPVVEALARAAEDVAQRAGARVVLELEPGLRATPAARDALRRIVREAVTNAVRHGNAQTVRLAARQTDHGLQVHIFDDGSGFDPARASGGFGLTTMRERTRALGGELHVRSAPGRGTEVEVALR
jgi:signal transduction histidine kinase